jgi:hypothetical protein
MYVLFNGEESANRNSRKESHDRNGSGGEATLWVSRVNGQGFQPCSLGQVKHQIHILDCLPSPSLDEVVQTANNYEPPRPQINSGRQKLVPQACLVWGGWVVILTKGAFL